MILVQEFDGHSFMLLTLNDCNDYLNLKFGNALKLATIVVELKHKYMVMFNQKALGAAGVDPDMFAAGKLVADL